MRVLTAAVTGDSQLRLLFSDGFCSEIDYCPDTLREWCEAGSAQPVTPLRG